MNTIETFLSVLKTEQDRNKIITEIISELKDIKHLLTSFSEDFYCYVNKYDFTEETGTTPDASLKDIDILLNIEEAQTITEEEAKNIIKSIWGVKDEYGDKNENNNN